MNMRHLAVSLGFLVLLGAGCATNTPTPSPTSTNGGTVTPVPTGTTPMPIPTPTSTTGTLPNPTPTSTTSNATSTSVTIDDTWGTYTNKALAFEFRYPKKGSYAPQWEALIKKEGDKGMRAGCFESMEMTERNVTEQVMLGGTSFCHTSYVDAGAGNAYMIDYYTTSKNNQYVVLSFTKHVVSAGALNCDFMNQYPYSLNGQSCMAFKPEEYKNMLQTIGGSFRSTTP